jgi:hypothetical protein
MAYWRWDLKEVVEVAEIQMVNFEWRRAMTWRRP